jgi:hypothetical protein
LHDLISPSVAISWRHLASIAIHMKMHPSFFTAKHVMCAAAAAAAYQAALRRRAATGRARAVMESLATHPYAEPAPPPHALFGLRYRPGPPGREFSPAFVPVADDLGAKILIDDLADLAPGPQRAFPVEVAWGDGGAVPCRMWYTKAQVGRPRPCLWLCADII